MATGGSGRAPRVQAKKATTVTPYNVKATQRAAVPAARKSGYSMDAARAEAREEPFPVERNGVWWDLPRVTALPLDLAAKLDTGAVEAITDVLRELLGEDQFLIFIGETPLEIGETQGMLPAWLEHSGVSQGE
jgi:hypothetical protein